MGSLKVLRFLVTGAGVAGLTIAYLLKQAGHDVVVLEKSSRSDQVSAQRGGVRIPPNMTRLLLELPRTENLLNIRATKSAGCVFHEWECSSQADVRYPLKSQSWLGFVCINYLLVDTPGKDGDTAELVGQMVFAEEIMNDLGSDFYFIPHRDLHEHLYTLCIDTGVEICHGFEAVEILTCDQALNKGNNIGPTVIGKSGKRINGDIVIGADGKHSVARQVLLSEAEETDDTDCFSDSESEKSALPPMKFITGATIEIPASLIQSDPELASLMEMGEKEKHWMVYMANETSIAIAQYGPDLYTLDLTYAKPPEPLDKDDEWLSTGTPIEKMLSKVGEYEPRWLHSPGRIKKLIQLGSTSHWNIQTVYDLPGYVSKLGQVVIMGDAAHSVYINGTQNTAAAFEDAFTFGRLFSQLPSPSESKSNASLLLSGYQQIKQKRSRALETNGMDTLLLLGIPEGPEREGRNNGFRLTLHAEGADDATLAHVWAGYVAQFNYDARDAVDEWWMNWARVGSQFSTIVDGVSVVLS
ncbi:hypothetical protein GYMLUDRAFT_81035 [Collybiopsis luxurians FD-317 M1]|nr:hypothetical protein GYMLUDRAFT_81035 [Collybiopsis luxurians FD-317 M1]